MIAATGLRVGQDDRDLGFVARPETQGRGACAGEGRAGLYRPRLSQARRVAWIASISTLGHATELHQCASSRMTESGARVLVAEGMMGLFDGAIDGKGSSPIWRGFWICQSCWWWIALRQSHSIAALVWGFSQFRKDVLIEGVILNRVGSPRHEAMLRGRSGTPWRPGSGRAAARSGTFLAGKASGAGAGGRTCRS